MAWRHHPRQHLMIHQRRARQTTSNFPASTAARPCYRAGGGAGATRNLTDSMKRVREPFAQAGSRNSLPLPPASGGKRVRPEVQQQQLYHDHRSRTATQEQQQQQQQQQQQGPFQALLAEHGVVWPSAGGLEGDSETERRSSLGFSCRRNPSKLRVGLKRALVHDRARRGEFVEGMKEFMEGPVHALRRALLPLDCCGENRGGGGGG
ncbi:unnamed protein product, partial [Pylaiella littoralis]